MRIVIKLGGSILASPLNVDRLQGYVDVVKGLREAGHEVFMVIGGGKVARMYSDAARSLGLSNEDQDDVAIHASRLNALLFVKTLGPLAYPKVPATLEEALEAFSMGKIVVLAGLRPGITTDTVAAMLAERMGADMLLKATDVAGVYKKDPRLYPDAEKIDRISFKELGLMKRRHEPGIHVVLDGGSIDIIMRSRVKTVIFDGRDPMNLLLAVKGEHVGTLIS